MLDVFKRHKKALLPILILLIGVAVFALLKATKPEPPVRPVSERSWPVHVQTVAFADHTPVVTAFGEIHAGLDGDLRPRVGGTVLSVHPDLGEGLAVQEGTTLVVIDDFDYQASLRERQADHSEAEARLQELELSLQSEEKLLPVDRQQVNIAAREVERQNKLLKRKTVSRKSYDDALSTLNGRKQNVLIRQQNIAKLNSQIAQAQSALIRAVSGLEKAQRNLDDTQLKAPFDGFITDTNVTAGKQVATNDKIATLVALGRMEVLFHLPERKYAHLTRHGPLIGKPVTFTVQGTTVKAEIVRTDGRIDAQTGGRKVFAALAPQDLTTPLRPGLFVEVQLEDQLYQNVVSLPKSALHDNQFIYVVKDGRLEKRDVEMTATHGDQVLISKGLNRDEKVCLTRFAEMGSGIQVVVK